jgi:cobalt-zinc-cadmium efflux system protein
LLADSAHMTSDVLALVIALVAVRIARRPATDRHTYGYGRAEILAAQINGLLLFVAAGAIALEAVRRFGEPPEFDAAGVLVIGGIGLVVNAVSAVVVGHVSHGDLNMRAATWHLVADALGSVAVVVAALGSIFFGLDGLDSVASLLIAAMIVAAAWRLLRDTSRVLLEGAPAGIDVGAVRTALAASDGVEAVHHVHVWSLDSAKVAMSAHVVLQGPLSLHEAQEHAQSMKAMLAREFAIEHATIEVECHACVDDHAPLH